MTITTTVAATAATTPDTTTTGGNGVKRVRSSIDEVPPWVLVMINIQYNCCMIHSKAEGKYKLDRFCIDCCSSFCNKCSSNHHGHKSIKIRRYVYQDVINRPEAQKLFDCKGIQGYVLNKSKVLFLRQRQESQDDQHVKDQQQNTRNNNCIICKRSLPDSRYCSIQCKVSAMYQTVKTEEGEETEDGLYNAIKVPTTLMASKRKRQRKGFPNRAPML